MPLVLGVDSSTQSTKVELRDADDGRLVASGRASHAPTFPPRSEQDPDGWWEALRAAVAALPPLPIDAVAVAAQQMGLVAVDAAGRPVRPAKLWNDTESAPQSRRLVERLGAAAWARACGSVPVASFTVTKLAWLRDNEPSSFARMAHALLPHDWLTWRLADRFVTDRGDASGTGWWSPGEGRYREDLLALVDADRDWTTMLPTVLGPIETAGSMTARAARELGLKASGALVAPGTGDNMAAALGVGLVTRDVVVSLGTSGTVYALSETPTADATGAVGGFADATGRFLPLACTLNATKVTDVFARLLSLDRAAFEAAAAGAPPGARGVVLVPYLDGERTPNVPEATGSLVGLRSDADASLVARAAFEGVVCGLLDALDALAAAGVDTSGRLLLVGGGAKSTVYRRVFADLAQRVLTVPLPLHGELVATGACVQAAAVLHGRPPQDVAAAWGLGRGQDLEPDPHVDAKAVRAAYSRARESVIG